MSKRRSVAKYLIVRASAAKLHVVSHSDRHLPDTQPMTLAQATKALAARKRYLERYVKQMDEDIAEANRIATTSKYAFTRQAALKGLVKMRRRRKSFIEEQANIRLMQLVEC